MLSTTKKDESGANIVLQKQFKRFKSPKEDKKKAPTYFGE